MEIFPLRPPWRSRDWSVSGKIDRVDRNERTGAVRVLDYKTSDRAVAPRGRPLPPAAARWFGTPGAQRGAGSCLATFEWVWTDLQLPLYVQAVAAEFGNDVACGYFNLPKATGERRLPSGTTVSWRRVRRHCAARRVWPPRLWQAAFGAGGATGPGRRRLAGFVS